MLDSNISFNHTNIRSLKRNLEKFQTKILAELEFHFNIIVVTQTRMNSSSGNPDFTLQFCFVILNRCQRLFRLEV